ncbi:putative selenoprotein SelK/SelG [Plasmopara halstedii]
MTYITEGVVVEKRSRWRLSIVTDVVWGAINFVGLFFSSIFSDPSHTLRSNSNISQDSTRRIVGGNGRGGPRRMGQVNHRQSTCGSCCG